MKRNILTRVFVIVLMFIFVLPITVAHATENAYSQNAGNSTVYMHDLANLLTDAEEEQLITMATNKCQNISFNILFLTTNDANGKSTMAYSDDYMDVLFPVGTEDNIAFIIDMDNREIYINTMGKAIECLSDGMIDAALDNSYDDIVDEDYVGCMNAMASYCLVRLSDTPGKVTFSNALTVLTDVIIAMARTALFALINTAVVIVIVIWRHNKANKTQSATTYVSNENYEILDKNVVFVRSYETVQHGYYKPKSSSSGGGGSSHRSSSGRSHGGGGRSF